MKNMMMSKNPNMFNKQKHKKRPHHEAKEDEQQN